MQYCILKSWRQSNDMKNTPLTLWLEIALVTSQQESWVGKLNKYQMKSCTLSTTRYNETLQGRWLLWPPRTLSKPPLSTDILSWSLWQSFGLRGKSNCVLSPPSDAALLYIFPLLSQLYTIPPHDAWLLTAASHYWLLLGGLFSKARSTCIFQ